MKRKGLEQLIVVLLFILVMVVFFFAERDSKKLDRLYNTTQRLPGKASANTAQLPPVSAGKVSN